MIFIGGRHRTFEQLLYCSFDWFKITKKKTKFTMPTPDYHTIDYKSGWSKARFP